MRRSPAAVVLLCGLAMLTTSCRQSAQGYLAKGNQFFASGKTDDAILNFKKAIQKDQRFGEAHYRLALAELKAGQPRDAYAALSSANNLLPDRTDVKVTLADLLLLSYASDKSRPAAFYTQLKKLADELIARDPNSYDGFRIKGDLAWSDGQDKDAEQFFRKANAAKPMTPDLVVSLVQVLFREGQSEEAEQLGLQLIQAHKDAGLIYDVLYAHYRSLNQPAQAENVLRTKIANNPHRIDYVLQLAGFYAGSGKREQMTATLQRLLDDPKSSAAAHLKLGDFHAAMHDWAEAMRLYQEGIRIDPDNKTTYLHRIADAWIFQGKAAEASNVIAEIRKDRPGDDSAKAVNASILLESGVPDKVKAGVNDLQELVKKQPENPVFRYALSRGLLLRGDPDGARAQFQELLKRQPRHLPSLVNLAELSLNKRDYAQALKYADTALAVNPRLTQARLQRATALTAQGNTSAGRTELTSLANDDPQNIQVQFELAALDVTEKKYLQAEVRLQKLYEKSRFVALTGLVDAYLAQDQTDKAIARLIVEVGKAPKIPYVRTMLAEVYMRVRKYDLALEQYNQAQNLGDRSGQLLMRLGRAYELKGDMGKALANFETAKLLAPQDPVALRALADAQQTTGSKKEAVLNYRRILALNPEDANTMNNLAYTLLDTGGPLDEAQALVEHAMQKAPKNPDFADTLGMVYLKKNLGGSAVQVFSGLVQRYPENPAFRYHYGMSLSENGQRVRAKTELEVALHKSPNDTLRRSIQSSLAAIQQ
jgi:tetratricopeptide (TPR) repeat protein